MGVRVQDLLGWTVPIAVIAWSGSGLVVSVSNRRLGDSLLSLGGLAFGWFLTARLLRGRQDWLRSQESQTPGPSQSS